MVFSSYIFLFGFLPLFLAAYFAAPKRGKNHVALIGSCLFYAWGAPGIIPLLMLGIFLDYWLSRRMVASPYRAKLFLTLGVAGNLAFLFYYKYANFFVAEWNRARQYAGFEPVAWAEVLLPIGISFFTFQKISYLIDVYRGGVRPARSVLDYALYVVLFPQLIAGPIVRYHDIDQQLRHRSIDIDGFCAGIVRFCLGLAKKVLIADPLGAVADNVFSLRSSAIPVEYAWLGAFCYSFQIYFDFSGYSDMALGLGRMLGFRFLENFNMPYIAQNFTEFWRRWHISLSNWMREYLYVPLGGNRVGNARRFANLWIVFLASGLWHGASWNFVVWGALHGFFLSLDKLGWHRWQQALPRAVNVAITFLLVTVTWVFFRAENLPEAWAYLTRMFDFASFGQTGQHLMRANIIHNRAAVVFVIAAGLCFLPLNSKVQRFVESFGTGEWVRFGPVLAGSGALALFLLSVVSLASVDFTPFLYFRF